MHSKGEITIIINRYKIGKLSEEYIKEMLIQNPQEIYETVDRYYEDVLNAKIIRIISRVLSNLNNKDADELVEYIDNLYIKKFKVEREEARILQILFSYGLNVTQYREGDSCIEYTTQFSKVIKLHLYNCPFGWMPELFRLKNLRELKITSQHVKNDFNSLSKLPNLRFLSIYDNSIKDMDDLRILSKLTNLEVFKLTNNQIIQIKHLENLKKLKKLTFLGSKIRGYYGNITKIKGLENLSNLTDLTIKRHKIEEISGLESLVNLQDLDLSYNNITEIRGIEKLKKLYTIDLSHNKVKKIPEWLLEAKRPNIYLGEN